jgi:hypothetical protein
LITGIIVLLFNVMTLIIYVWVHLLYLLFRHISCRQKKKKKKLFKKSDFLQRKHKRRDIENIVREKVKKKVKGMRVHHIERMARKIEINQSINQSIRGNLLLKKLEVIHDREHGIYDKSKKREKSVLAGEKKNG